MKRVNYYLRAIYNRLKPKRNGTRIFTLGEEERILIVAPHPDDESIGCGGVLARYGTQADILLMTDGRHGNPEWTEDYTIEVRNQEFLAAMRYAGVNNIYYANAEDGKLSRFAKLPSIDWKCYRYVFVPNRSENHPDHRSAFLNISRHLRFLLKRHCLVEYEVWSPISNPNLYFPMDDEQMKAKCSLITHYSCQLKHIDYITRIKGLNEYRGVMCNSPYSEGYRFHA